MEHARYLDSTFVEIWKTYLHLISIDGRWHFQISPEVIYFVRTKQHAHVLSINIYICTMLGGCS